MDGFLLYLFGVVVRDVRKQGTGGLVQELGVLPSARRILIESLQTYPCNW